MRVNRKAIGLVSLIAALGILAAFSSSALALAPRSFDSQVTTVPAGKLAGITFDASEDLWLSYGEEGGTIEEPANGRILEYNPYPSGTLLSEFTSEKFHRANCSGSSNNETIGIDRATGNVYVAENGCGGIQEFTPGGKLIAELPLYNASPSIGGGPAIAVDNSSGPTHGRVYSAFDFGYEAIEYHSYIGAFDEDLKPARFSGEKPYIKGTRILGTPSGNFGGQSVVSVTTDANGNIYAWDRDNAVIDEFNSAGEFLRGFTGAEAPETLACFNECGIAVDPTNQHLLFVQHPSGFEAKPEIYEWTQTGTFVRAIGTKEVPGGIGTGGFIAVDSNGFLYLVDNDKNVIDIFNAAVIPPKVTNEEATEQTAVGGRLNATVDPNTAGDIVSCKFEYGTAVGTYDLGTQNCAPDPGSAPPGSHFAVPTQVHLNLTGLTPETPYHYRVVVENELGTVAKGGDQVFTPHYVHALRTDPASAVTGISATLNGSFVGNGDDTHYYFEWGKTTAYGNNTAAVPGKDAGSPSGPGRTSLSAALTGLEPLTKYHYRVVGSNGEGVSRALDGNFVTGKSSPLVQEGAIDVHSDNATLAGQIDAGGESTEYFFEWGTEDCEANPGACTVLPARSLGSAAEYVTVTEPIGGLMPETTYHFRLVASNGLGDGGYDTTFTTFPAAEAPIKACENNLARQQTGASQLLDCRAYELVSASNTGGYDVESDLVPGQKPYGGYREASGAQGTSRVLYGVHNGAIPGVAGDPTNKEVDPYIATRGANGWTTTYVGLPADNPNATGPFSSVPSGADASLQTFAFGGAGSCSPCFEGGYTGIPLHLANGAIAQGMTATGLGQPPASFKADGYVAKDISADGSHFVFASTSRFAPGGNDSTGDVSIYDRNLDSGETKVVSNAPGGGPLACPDGAGECHAPGDADGIAGLDVSRDGSHVLLGQKVSTDDQGNVYWHLYMDVDDGAQSIDLTPGATDGVLYGGMTEDGSKVFFTTYDALAGAAPADTDLSADVYEAEVSEGGAVSLARLSSGAGAGDTDSCDAAENQARTHWNSVGLADSCDAVLLAGGGGVASGSGAVYFLTPEQLEAGEGTAGQPNLYVAKGAGAPRFVATLDPNDPAVVDALSAAATRRTADFETTPSGDFAVFSTTAHLLPGAEDHGFGQVYRYSTADGLACVSCNPTNAASEGSASLAGNGSSLTDDGRVFFNSPNALVIRDADHRQDVYEWENGEIQLVSSGSSAFASSLLGASADGTDAFFFTHDALAKQDNNGPVTKLYDARTEGGFFEVPPPPPCAASDECHGASSPAQGPPEIRTVTGKPSNVRNCKKGFVKKQGKCVKKKTHKRKNHRRRGHRHG